MRPLTFLHENRTRREPLSLSTVRPASLVAAHGTRRLSRSLKGEFDEIGIVLPRDIGGGGPDVRRLYSYPGAGVVRANETKTAAPQVVPAQTYNAVTKIYFTNIAVHTTATNFSVRSQSHPFLRPTLLVPMRSWQKSASRLQQFKQPAYFSASGPKPTSRDIRRTVAIGR